MPTYGALFRYALPQPSHSTGAGRVQSFGRLNFNPRFHGLGSASCRVAHASRVSGDGVPAIANFPSSLKSVLRFLFSEKIVSAGRRNQHARRVRYPAACAPRNSGLSFQVTYLPLSFGRSSLAPRYSQRCSAIGTLPFFQTKSWKARRLNLSPCCRRASARSCMIWSLPI